MDTTLVRVGRGDGHSISSGWWRHGTQHWFGLVDPAQVANTFVNAARTAIVLLSAVLGSMFAFGCPAKIVPVTKICFNICASKYPENRHETCTTNTKCVRLSHSYLSQCNAHNNCLVYNSFRTVLCIWTAK